MLHDLGRAAHKKSTELGAFGRKVRKVGRSTQGERAFVG